MNLGCTGPGTGDCQPIGMSPSIPFQMPMPRVGKTLKRKRPLSISISSTPSLKPPRSKCWRTEKGGSVSPKSPVWTSKSESGWSFSSPVSRHFLVAIARLRFAESFRPRGTANVGVGRTAFQGRGPATRALDHPPADRPARGGLDHLGPGPAESRHDTIAHAPFGRIELDFPVVQAALSGYSDWAMRVIARRLGRRTRCVKCCSTSSSIKSAAQKGRPLPAGDRRRASGGGPIDGGQTRRLRSRGPRLVAAGFDVIDINFGCPVKKVLGRCRGGYLLGQVDTALEIVGRVREAVPAEIPVTVKMRRGLDDRPRAGTTSIASSTAISSGASRPSRCTAGRSSSGTSGRAAGISCAKLKQHAGPRTVLGSGDLFTPRPVST